MANRPTMGTSAYDTVKNVSGTAGNLKAKGGAQAGDPTAPGTQKMPGQTVSERLGAAYHIGAAMSAPITDPAAGATQGNGRTVRPVTNRSRTNFDEQIAAIQAT